MGRVTTSDGAPSTEEAQRAAAIVAALGKNAGSEDVFAAFEELDALPAEVVASVLTPWTGPAPDPQQLDAATRRAHGFPPLPLEVHTIRILKPKRADELGRVGQEQVRVAGTTWDGLDLDASARLATDGSESSFAGTLEHRVVSDEDGQPLFDVLLYAGDSGAIFRAGTTEVVGAIAYGTVELKDRRARVALQESLATTEPEVVTPKAKPVPEVVAAPKPVAAKPVAAKPVAPVEALDEEEEEAPISSEAPTKRVLATKPAAKTKVAAKKTTAAASKKTAKAEAAPAKKTAAKKKTAAAKKAAPAKKTAAKKTAVPKKVAAKKTTAKTAAKKTAATKPAAKKTAAPKKVASKKTTAKKPAASTTKKKAASATKAPAKKTAVKKATAKKTTAKKKTSTKK